MAATVQPDTEPSMKPEDIGQRFHDQRVRLNLTRAQMADLMGCDVDTYSDLERGRAGARIVALWFERFERVGLVITIRRR